MKENIVISDKGQITLPAAMRKSLGLGKSAVLTAEQVGGKIVLTPAVVLETEIYTDEQIAEWDSADAFKKGERQRLASKLMRRRG
jgi:AbrB family looped-hinge helix DNA binding protein